MINVYLKTCKNKWIPNGISTVATVKDESTTINDSSFQDLHQTSMRFLCRGLRCMTSKRNCKIDSSGSAGGLAGLEIQLGRTKADVVEIGPQKHYISSSSQPSWDMAVVVISPFQTTKLTDPSFLWYSGTIPKKNHAMIPRPSGWFTFPDLETPRKSSKISHKNRCTNINQQLCETW